MDNAKYLACGQEISSSLSDSSVYCYKHTQVYESLIAEYKAMLNAYGNNNTSPWKEFLLKKLSENKTDEIEQMINAELKIAG